MTVSITRYMHRRGIASMTADSPSVILRSSTVANARRTTDRENADAGRNQTGTTRQKPESV